MVCVTTVPVAHSKHYIAWDAKMGRDVEGSSLEVLSQNMPGGVEERHEEPQSRQTTSIL
jgi:hypothetical protein